MVNAFFLSVESRNWSGYNICQSCDCVDTRLWIFIFSETATHIPNLENATLFIWQANDWMNEYGTTAALTNIRIQHDLEKWRHTRIALRASKHWKTIRRFSKGLIPSDTYESMSGTGGMNLKTTVSLFGKEAVSTAVKSASVIRTR